MSQTVTECQVHPRTATPTGRISRELAFDKKCHLADSVVPHRVYKLAAAS